MDQEDRKRASARGGKIRAQTHQGAAFGKRPHRCDEPLGIEGKRNRSSPSMARRIGRCASETSKSHATSSATERASSPSAACRAALGSRLAAENPARAELLN